MAIYSKFGGKVQITRVVTDTGDVQKLEMRSSNTHDLKRIEQRCYVAGNDPDSDYPEIEHLYDISDLRADNGISEIMDAMAATELRQES